MLSWMRWLTSWFWNIVNSDGISGGGFLQWFSNNWLSLAIFLIIIGAIADWIIWMIRWRPHWLWLRKRQIIYEEVPAKKHRPAESDDPFRNKKVDLRKAPRPIDDSDADDFEAPLEDPYAPAKDVEEDYDDPFAEEFGEDEDSFSDWDSSNDPYASEE